MKTRTGTISTEVVAAGEGANQEILRLTHEPLGNDTGDGPRTTYLLTTKGPDRSGDYLFVHKQDGDLARALLRERASLDDVTAVAQGIREAADRLVKAVLPA